MSLQTKISDATEVGTNTYRGDSRTDICNIRLAHMDDLGSLKKLATIETQAVFGDVNFVKMLDMSHISMCVENSETSVVAAICLCDHPNIPSIPPWEWGHWLLNIYQLELIVPRNTLWIHLAVFDVSYTRSFLRPLMKSIYGANSFLEYIIAVVPPEVGKLDWLEGYGTRIMPAGFHNPYKVQSLYLISRQHFVNRYKIRRAVEEDNDDLVPLIHMHSERLQQQYGEFYIAEMITRHPDAGRQLIVAEHDEQAVAVLCLNAAINHRLLSHAFELIPFNGLRKPHVDDTVVLEDLEELSAVTVDLADRGADAAIQPLTGEESQKSVGEPEEEEVAENTVSDESADDFSIVNLSSIDIVLYTEIGSNESFSSRCSSSSVDISFEDYKMHLFAEKSDYRLLSCNDIDYRSSRDIKSCSNIPQEPSFYGEINAFVLELAVTHPEHELESLVLLLEAAFECFPNRDYCVLSVPSACPPFPILKHFSRVAPRPASTYLHELYLLHRNVLSGTSVVRSAVPSDVDTIKLLTDNISLASELERDFASAVSNYNNEDDFRAFILENEGHIVGAAVVKDAEDVEYLRSHYELSTWVNEDHHKSGCHGLLKHLVLSPIFQRHSRFFLREIHRLSDFSVLYYCVYPADTFTAMRGRVLCCVLSDLLPVKPRPNSEFTQTNLEGCSPPDVVHRIDPPFALYISTSRHCTLPRYEINKRIVVVGASDTALAFLESLICSFSHSYYVTFTNVTMISPDGLPYQKSENQIRDMMFVKKSTYSYRYMHLTALRTYVNVVNATMTRIDRKNKLLILNDNNFLPYDLLFLMCGRQFQKPTLPNVQKDKKQKNVVVPFPENVYLVNSENDATQSLLKLKYLISINKKQTLYGQYMEAYTCLATLLEYGIPGENIIFVEPFPVVSKSKFSHTVSRFNDGEVDEAINAAIKNEGITAYSSYYFIDWALDKNTNKITSVQFETRNKRIFLDCIAMFMYNDKTVSMRTFLAISKAGLVFDGALVIGPDFQTNDPNIFAAGTITKYSRRYYADHMVHKYYNLQEIGHKLGQNIRRKIIPFWDEEEELSDIFCTPGNMLVPSFEKPLMTYCKLPGNLRYLSVRKPGYPVPLEVAMSAEDYGQVYVTGDYKHIEKQGYFRLHLNSYGVVETITCLAKFDIDYINLTSIWGKHEKLLNNFQTRFEMVLITDLFEYFREPWMCAIYHDRFPLLEKEIKRLMASYTSIPGKSLVEDLVKMFKENEWHKLTFDQREEIEEKFMGSPYHQQLEQKVLDFLRDNDTFLPMYAHPNIVRNLLQGCENSPLFEPQ